MAPLTASLAFMKNNAANTLTFGRGVFQDLTGNPGFATLPATWLPQLASNLTDLETASANYLTGGTTETAIQEQKRLAVNQLLHKIAIFCQENCNNDEAVFLSSGFLLASTNHGSSPLPKCILETLTNGATGQLIASAEPMDNAKSWEARWWVGVNPPQHAECLKPKRIMTIISLPSGQIINVQMRAHGGSTGFSDWSDTVQHMCM